MATKKSSKKKSAAYRLINKETGTHYVIRYGREGYDKMREKKVKKYDPKTQKHELFEVRKTSK